MSSEEIRKVEHMVNDMIRQNNPVEEHRSLPMSKAREMGAVALFGEKYGDIVRVVQMGAYSLELCGGVHVKNTSEIGYFKILSEGGIGAGTRRIEAVTGQAAFEYMNTFINRFAAVAETLKTKPALLEERVEGVLDELKEAHRENESLKSKLL